MRAFRYLSLFVMILPLAILSACSGSGGSSGAPAVPSTTVSGVVAAGPAAGVTVIVTTTAGTEVARTTAPTDANGAFSLGIPTSALASDLVFETSGGSYPDEATATAGVALGMLTAHVPAGTLLAGANVTIDPASTIVQKLVAGGMTRGAAQTAFVAAFGYTSDSSVKPAFATMSSASSDAQRLAGVRAAAFSQLTRDLGMSPNKQGELIQALADDLSDGILDGKKNGTPVTTASGTAIPEDIANCFGESMMAFEVSSLNRSKLTPDKLSGTLSFSKVALSGSYRVEYLPGAMPAAQGKTSFRIKLTNLATGTPAPGKSVSLMPVMHMATMTHSAPVGQVVDNGDGTYSCTVYYLMASGSGMGVWELKVNIGAETAAFYPSVAMAMGSTTRATLRGISDKIPAMAGGMASSRTWYLFNDGLSGTGPYSFTIFLAALDNAMLTAYPAVSVGTVLHDQNSTAWTASSVTVEASTDKTTWVAATDNGNGRWSAAGLTGLGSGGHIYVRVTVNGEQKTTDGASLSATNGAADFTISSGQ